MVAVNDTLPLSDVLLDNDTLDEDDSDGDAVGVVLMVAVNDTLPLSDVLLDNDTLDEDDSDSDAVGVVLMVGVTEIDLLFEIVGVGVGRDTATAVGLTVDVPSPFWLAAPQQYGRLFFTAHVLRFPHVTCVTPLVIPSTLTGIGLSVFVESPS